MYETASDGLFQPISNTSILRIEGKDAIDFAQSQFSNDVRALALNEWQWNAWLNAKGRVLTLFMLLRSGEQELLLVSADMPATQLVEALSRMVFRRKAVLTIAQDVCFQGHFGEALATSPSVRVSATEGPSQWRGQLDDASGRIWRIGPPPTNISRDEGFQLAWRIADLRRGLPHLPPQGSDLTAHQLGLDRLPALSLSKGCYPGQEIVARTHYLGKAHRRIARLCASSPLRDGAKLMVEGREVATLLNAIQTDQNTWEALASLPAEDDTLQTHSRLHTADGALVVRLPFEQA